MDRDHQLTSGTTGGPSSGLRPLERRELFLVIVAGIVAFVVSGIVLSPWPDLLGDEARRMGQFRWCMELLKSPIPLVLLCHKMT